MAVEEKRHCKMYFKTGVKKNKNTYWTTELLRTLKDHS